MEINITETGNKIFSVDVGNTTIAECIECLQKISGISKEMITPEVKEPNDKDIGYWLEQLKQEFYPLEDFDGCNGHTFEDLINDESELFSVEEVDNYGGEDCGSEYWMVFKVVDLTTKEEAYIKFEGSYDSWNGTDWDNMAFLVKPVKKVVTVFEVIK